MLLLANFLSVLDNVLPSYQWRKWVADMKKTEISLFLRELLIFLLGSVHPSLAKVLLCSKEEPMCSKEEVLEIGASMEESDERDAIYGHHREAALAAANAAAAAAAAVAAMAAPIAINADPYVVLAHFLAN